MTEVAGTQAPLEAVLKDEILRMYQAVAVGGKSNGQGKGYSKPRSFSMPVAATRQPGWPKGVMIRAAVRQQV